MTARELASIFTNGPVIFWLLNFLWLAVLAAPLSWLWNMSVAPLFSVPALSYGRALGLLLLWYVLWLAYAGMKWSTASPTERSSMHGGNRDE